MYVYSCKSGQMYRINLLFKLWLPAAWKVHGGPCASVHLAKCLKSNQMFIPTWQYSISGHDFCGLSFVKECALNPRVLKFFKSSQPLFNIKSPHNYFHEFFNPIGNVLLYQEYSSVLEYRHITIHGMNSGVYTTNFDVIYSVISFVIFIRNLISSCDVMKLYILQCEFFCFLIF